MAEGQLVEANRQSHSNHRDEDELLIEELMRKVPELRAQDSQFAGTSQQRAAGEVSQLQHKENYDRLMMSHAGQQHQQQIMQPAAAHQQQSQAPLEGVQARPGQLPAAHQQQLLGSGEPMEHYLMRNSRNQQLLALEHLRAMSSCSNESSATSNGRNSSIGDHNSCFLEPYELHDSTMSSNSSLSGLYTRLARRVRLLESPSDSGFDSGKENGSHSALGFARTSLAGCHFRSVTPNETSSSTCMSPINELLYHRARANSAASRKQLGLAGAQTARYPNLDLNQLSQQQQQQLALARNLTMSGRPASALGQSGAHLNVGRALAAPQHPRPHSQNHDHNSAGQQTGSIDDMPMLKRALQAPPLINTNMLMDEAYRHHKKFRAAQRREQVDTPTVGSTSGCPSSAAVSRAISPAARSPSPHQHPAESSRPAGSSSSSSISSSLANMHSTLLSKLNQPSNLQLSQQQLKRNDLIHEMILRDSPPPTGTNGASASPIPSGAVAPVSSPVSTSSSQASNEHQNQAEIRSNLQRILISGQQKQQLDSKLGLVDEDYLAKRLLGSGSFRRHQQRHYNQSPEQPMNTGQQRPSAHHRPSSSCASSSSPSPTSSLSTSSPSPSSSVSPDLGMVVLSTPSSGRSSSMAHANHQRPSTSIEMDHSSQHHDESARQVPQLTSSCQYIDQHLSYHRSSANPNTLAPTTLGSLGPQTGQGVHSLLDARSPVSPISSCDAHSNLAHYNSACPSPASPRIAGCHLSNQISHIGNLSLNCTASTNNSTQSNSFSSSSNASTGDKLNLLQVAPLGLSSISAPVGSEGSFGLLADVAVAAAEEQSRIERQQQEEAAAVAAAVGQPIDLSMK